MMKLLSVQFQGHAIVDWSRSRPNEHSAMTKCDYLPLGLLAMIKENLFRTTSDRECLSSVAWILARLSVRLAADIHLCWVGWDVELGGSWVGISNNLHSEIFSLRES